MGNNDKPSKIDQAALEKAIGDIDKLRKRVDEMAEHIKAEGGVGMKLHKFKDEQIAFLNKYKNEIIEMLKKHHEERKEVEERISGSHNAMAEAAQGGFDMLHKGLIRAEHRMNLIWNAFNGLVRLIENFLTGSLPNVGGLWTRETYTKALLEAGTQVYRESIEHERSELTRLKAEKAEHGKIISGAKPRPMDAADKLLAHGTTLVETGIKEHGAELRELNNLRREAFQEDMKSRTPPELTIDLEKAHVEKNPDGSTTITADAQEKTNESNDQPSPAAE